MTTLPVINMTATGENIARLRTQKQLTVRQLQEIFGFATPQAIYKWQRGTVLPTVDNLVILSAVLGVPVDEILVVR
ncbi:MAG: helix-turn-helix transcriptional regulator [Lachnospiraceae bacterium]|nr:helix-turn-helix transcriptional regulator [Lachnospiraceae bacterium]MBQ1515291.1 helix-turn-helix transcriptional regulator [Lachnospiraceae bacterium]